MVDEMGSMPAGLEEEQIGQLATIRYETIAAERDEVLTEEEQRLSESRVSY